MTFSIIGFCKRTQTMGYAITTGTPAIGQRCCDIVPGIGLFLNQAYADIRRRGAIIELMKLGHAPEKVLRDISDGDDFHDYRQIAILDLFGRSAVYTGPSTVKWSGHTVGPDHVAAGNVLAGEQVVQKVSDAFSSADGEALEERLMRAIEAGRDAGGQPDGQTSAAIKVLGGFGDYPADAPFLDLRVDASLEPIGELRKIFDWYRPLVPFYFQFMKNPVSTGRHKEFLRSKGLKANPYEA